MVRLSERHEKWMKWVGENLRLWSVSGAAKDETWHEDDNYFKNTNFCNPEPSSYRATRVRVMKWDHAVQLGTCCICACTVHTLPSVGWRVFLQATETVLTLRKQFSPIVRGLKNAENSFCSFLNGFGCKLMMMKLFAGWLAILTKLSAGFTATAIVCIPFPLEQSRVVDWVVAEFLHLHLLWKSNASGFEFSQLL